MKTAKLVPEQSARLDEWAEKWIQIGQSTEPADFGQAIEAALKGYELANLASPMLVLHAGSPLSAMIGRRVGMHCLRELKKMYSDHPSDAILDNILNQACSAYGGHVSQEVLNQITKQIHDQLRYQNLDQNGGYPSAQVNDRALDHVWRQVWTCVLDKIGEYVDDHVWNRVLERVWHRVSNQFSYLFEIQGRDLVWDQVGDLRIFRRFAATDVPVASFFTFFRDVVRLAFDDSVLEQIRIAEKLAMSCGFVWRHANVLAIADRPEQIHRDAEGRLHNDRGPSISFRDGWCLYHWHGVNIPGAWVTGRPPSAKNVLSWRNIEQRRAACEIVGWKNILGRLKAKVIDEDADPEIGILFEAKFPGRGGRRERFLQVRCGTGREFVLPVPPHVNTALEANAWTWDIEDYEYRPEVRT